MSTDLDSPHALPTTAIQDFERDGFVRLKHVFTPEEIGDYGAEIARLTLQGSADKPPAENRSTYGRAFLQVTNLWERGGRARAFVFGKRLARIATRLLGVRGVRLYHDQSLMKEPGGGLTPAHADQFYWPLASDRCITAWVPLQPVPAQMGPIGFYAGSQGFTFGRGFAISEESERVIGAEMERQGFPLVDDPFAIGEVSFHLGWTFHRAGPNRTRRPRSVMTVIYMDMDMRLKAPENDMQQLDRDTFCPGARVGEVIATPKNPLLYERS